MRPLIRRWRKATRAVQLPPGVVAHSGHGRGSGILAPCPSGRIHKPLLGRNGRCPERASIEAEAAQLNRDYAIPRTMKTWCSGVSRRPCRASWTWLPESPTSGDRTPRLTCRWPPIVAAARRRDGCCAVCRRLHDLCGEPTSPGLLRCQRSALQVELPILGVVTRLVSDADRARQRVDLVRFAVGGRTGGPLRHCPDLACRPTEPTGGLICPV